MTTLPEEILEPIFRHLELDLRYSGSDTHDENDTKRRTLVALCQASKAFYRLARPIVYSTMDVALSLPDQIEALIETLATHPENQVSIKRLALGELTDNLRTPPLPTDDELRKDTIAWARKFGVPDTAVDRTYHGAARDRSETLGTCLLLHCRHTQTLEFTAPARRIERMIFEPVFGPENTLPHLQTVIMKRPPEGFDGFRGGLYGLSLLSPFLQTPSLRTLQVHLLWDYPGLPRSSLPKVSWSSQITNINLTCTNLSGSSFRGLLERCPMLQSLIVQWGDHTLQDCYVNSYAFGDALRRYGRGLRQLTLQTEGHYHLDLYMENEPIPTLLSLRQLTELRELTVRSTLLLGAPWEDDLEDDAGLDDRRSDDVLSAVLPASIERIDVHSLLDMEKEKRFLRDQLLSLKHEHREAFPALRSVCLNGQVVGERT